MSTNVDSLIAAMLEAEWPQPVDLARLRTVASEAVVRLVDRLEHEPGALRRRRICELLADVVAGEPGRLAPYLHTPSWYLARNLAYVLGEIRSAGAVPHLAALARHPEYRVRREVIDALHKLGGGAARAALAVFFEDPDARIRRHCIDGMGAVYDPHAAGWLLTIVQSRDFTPEGTSLKEAAVAALARMRADEARPVLEQVARRRWVFGRGRKLLQDAARGALAQAYSSR